MRHFFLTRMPLSLLMVALLSVPFAYASEADATAAPTPSLPVVTVGLSITDTVIGSGGVALGGSTVEVQYTGWLVNRKAADLHGRKFDTSIGKQPISFVLGTGRVIKGWDKGLVGMKVGGKRTLLISSALAYGKRGAKGRIPPDATLIFDVELISAK